MPTEIHALKDPRAEGLNQVAVAFITDVESMRTSAVLTGIIMQGVAGAMEKNFNSFVRQCPPNGNSNTSYLLPPDKIHIYRKLRDESHRAKRANEIVQRASLVSLVSQYDAFLSSLVKQLFVLQPGAVNSSKKTFEIADVLAFSSIDEVRDAIIDSEIESLLRESHHQQMAWLENKFDIRTLREFSAWADFVELTQRRNLFVHTDGIVSKQYLRICGEYPSLRQKLPSLGSQLSADGSYIRRSADVLFEVGIKLLQVLWRKVTPSMGQEADHALNEICYNLLERKRYGIATTLLDFAFDVIKQHSSTESRLRLLINRANAYKLQGNRERAVELLSKEDWGAYDVPFRLGAHIVRDEVDSALKCMELIGEDGPISKADYRVWPIFDGLRNNNDFRVTFEKIFSEPFIVDQVLKASEGNTEDLSMDFLNESETSALDSFFEVKRGPQNVLPLTKRIAEVN